MSRQRRGSGDPARKRSLSGEDIEQLGSTADFDVVQVRTPGLSRASQMERLIFFGILLLVGSALYVHLDVSPFLPIQVSSRLRTVLTGLSFLAMALGGLYWLVFLISMVYGRLVLLGRLVWRRTFAPEPRTVCPRCGALSPVNGFLEERGCPQCGSALVRCGRCGRPSDIVRFLSGQGCAYCGHEEIMVRR